MAEPNKLYYARNLSITIKLERANASIDGVPSIVNAISRFVNQWNDVWKTFSVQVSDIRTPISFNLEDQEKQIKADAKNRATLAYVATRAS